MADDVDGKGLVAKLYELCPEIRQLGIYPVILGKRNGY